MFVLLVLTRPDGILFVAAGLGSVWLPPRASRRREVLSRSLAIAVPVAVFVGAWAAFKLTYYGELLPTPFHSKSVTDPYWSQGFVYVGLYLAKNWFLAPALVILALLARGRNARRAGAGAGERADRAVLLGAAGIFTLYLVHVGGDFMFARRLLPVVPMVLVVLESVLFRLPATGARRVVAVLLVAAAAVPFPIFPKDREPRIQGVSDERRFYPDGIVEIRKEQAERVAAALSGVDARVMMEGGMLMWGYYSKLPRLVEMTGLTQYSLAKLPLRERGIPGHEKLPTAEWIEENRVHLLVRHDVPPVRPGRGPLAYDDLYFDGIARGKILLYSDSIMDPLRERHDVVFVPIEITLDEVRKHLAAASGDEAERLLDRMERFYFRGTGRSGSGRAQELRTNPGRRER